MPYNTVERVVEVPVKDIIVDDDRFRKTFVGIESLAESIKAVGLMNPIIVNEDMRLIAGERRLKAHILMELPTIKTIIRTHDQVRHRALEIIENLDRENFTWEEEVLATQELHKLMGAEYGTDWSQAKTAKKAGIAEGKVSGDLNLAKALKENPDIFTGATDKKTAFKRLKTFKIEEARNEIALRKAKTTEGLQAKNLIFHGNCLDLISNLPDKSIDAIISDPFYGLNISDVKKTDDKAGQDIYEDNKELYSKTMLEFVMKSQRVVRDDSWVVIFGAIENFQFLYNLLTRYGWNCDHMPGFWYRGNVGQTNDPNHRFARCYEMFIYGYRGDAVLKKPGSSLVLQYSGVNPAEKLHEVQKPLELMEDLIERFCLPGSTILVFMCGSGTTIVAAIRRACKCYGFELDEYNYNQAVGRVTEALKLKNAGQAELIR